MTLLDTFIMAFGSEGLGEIAKEITDTEKKVDELEKKEKTLNKTIKEGKDDTVKAKKELAATKREIAETKEKLDSLNGSTGGVILKLKNLTGTIAKIAGSFYALKSAIDFTNDFAQSAETISELAQNAQISTDKFQDLSNAMIHYGGSVESASSVMSKLKEELTDIQKGGTGGKLKEVALKYHIDTNTTEVDNFLQNVARKMETLSQDKKLELSNQLGLDPATFKLVSSGLDNYIKQLENANKYKMFTKEDVERSKEYEMTMRDIRMGTSAIGANLAQMLLPVMLSVAKVVKKVIDFFVEHGAFIKAMIIGIGAVLTAIAIPSIIKMGVALWSALAPVLPIILGVTAALVAFSLIAEDIYKWIHGEPSVAELIFGDFKTFADNFIKGLEQVKQAFSTSFIEGIKVLCKNLFDFITSAWNNTWNNIISKIPLIQNIIQKTQANQTSKVDGSHAAGLDYVPYDNYIAKLHKGERVLTAKEAIEDDKLKQWLDTFAYPDVDIQTPETKVQDVQAQPHPSQIKNIDNINKLNQFQTNLLSAKQAINFTSNYPLNSIPQNSISNAYNNTNSADNRTNTINISGITINTQATDAQGIADEFAKYVKEAVISLDDGMLA